MASEVRRQIASAARSMIGWGYLYGATGWICTAARVEQQATQYPAYAAKIRTYGLGKWLGKRCVDCAQLTKLSAKAAGLTLPSGASSQWNAGVWGEKGTINSLPEDSEGLFLYRQDSTDPSVMAHTGVCVGGGQVVEAKGHAYGVILSALSGAGWTHWARLNEGNAETNDVSDDTSDTRGGVGVSNLAGYLCAVSELKTGTTKLNVRAAASDTAGKAAVLNAGDQVTCLSDDGTWAKITTAAGVTGYCMSRYLTAIRAVSTDGDRLTLLEARVAALEVKVLGASQADG